MLRLALAALLAAAVSGCVLFDGSRRSGPDEFGVVTRAPLSQPPDYALRPPRSGAQRPNEVTPRDEARNYLLNASATSGDSRYAMSNGGNGGNGLHGANGANGAGGLQDALTPGEAALLKRADALNVDPEIRVLVDRESGRVKEDDSLVDALVFWRKEGTGGQALDAKKEADRLKRNAAIGLPPTGGEAKAP